MGRRRIVHIHVVRDADPWANEPRKGKGPGGGEWTSGGGSPGGQAAVLARSQPASEQTKQTQQPSGVAGSAAGTHIHFHQSAKSAGLEAAERQELEKEAQTYSDDVDWEKPVLAGVEADAKKLRGTHIHIHRADPYQQAYEQEAQTYGDEVDWKEPQQEAAQLLASKNIHIHQPATPVQGDDFDYKRYIAGRDDPNVTAQSILGKLASDRQAEVKELTDRPKQLETKGLYQGNGSTPEDPRYTPAREQMHDDILYRGVMGFDPDNPDKSKWYPPLIGPEMYAKACPPKGTKPRLVLLGGRGGSGKSSLKGTAYDDKDAIVLDSDHIKHMLPEFRGWNSYTVHEESSDILEQALKIAMGHKVNIVVDATLKSLGPAQEKFEAAKKLGYQREVHYMYLPRQEAAQRSMGRYFSPSKQSPTRRGRLVPPEVILGNTKNEENFAALRKQADKWSFWDNDVPQGQKPKLVAQKGGA